jgi:hypothetical protein
MKKILLVLSILLILGVTFGMAQKPVNTYHINLRGDISGQNDALRQYPVLLTNSRGTTFFRVDSAGQVYIGASRLLTAPTGSGDNPENFLYVTGYMTGLGTEDYSSNTRFITISGTRAAGYNTVRGDLQDNGIKISLTNRATANATGYSLRGFDVLAKSRASGNTTSIYGGYVCGENADDGGAAGDVYGLEATCKNGGVASGTVTALYALNQSPSATGTNYGILIDLSSEGTTVAKDAAIKIDATDGSWTYGLDLYGSTIGTGDIRFSFGSGCILTSYAGSPHTHVTAPKGSLCVDTTNGDLYVNTDASTTWAACKN